MIEGIVGLNLEATIRLRVADSEGHWHELQAVIDTGFGGFLTLPASIILALNLEPLDFNEAVLGNGTIHRFRTYDAAILWDDRIRNIEVDESDVMPLVGMSLLAGHELRIRVAEGDSVTVEALA